MLIQDEREERKWKLENGKRLWLIEWLHSSPRRLDNFTLGAILAPLITNWTAQCERGGSLEPSKNSNPVLAARKRSLSECLRLIRSQEEVPWTDRGRIDNGVDPPRQMDLRLFSNSFTWWKKKYFSFLFIKWIWLGLGYYNRPLPEEV